LNKASDNLKRSLNREQSVEEWFNQFKAAARDVFKDAKDVSVSKHFPHLDRWIELKSNPHTCECEECIKDMEKGNMAQKSTTVFTKQLTSTTDVAITGFNLLIT